MDSPAERLEAAQTAYDAIVMGESIRELRDQNGEMVSYGRPDLPRLAALIRTLERQVASPRYGTDGPLRPVY